MKSYLHNSFNMQELPEMFDELPLWSAPFGLALLDHVQYKKGITALDIGFGSGFPLTELAMRLGAEARVYGLDPWRAAAARARKKIDYYQIENVVLIEGVAEHIPLADAGIDLIVSNNGLNNVADLPQALHECARVCKSGAQFVQTLNLSGSMQEFYQVFESVMLAHDLRAEIKKMHDHIYQKRKPLEEIVAQMEKAGFVVTHIKEDQFLYRFSNATAMFHHYFYRLAFIDSWVKILPPEMVDPVFSEIEERLNNSAETAGGLQMTIPYAVIAAKRK